MSEIIQFHLTRREVTSSLRPRIQALGESNLHNHSERQEPILRVYKKNSAGNTTMNLIVKLCLCCKVSSGYFAIEGYRSKGKEIFFVFNADSRFLVPDAL